VHTVYTEVSNLFSVAAQRDYNSKCTKREHGFLAISYLSSARCDDVADRPCVVRIVVSKSNSCLSADACDLYSVRDSSVAPSALAVFFIVFLSPSRQNVGLVRWNVTRPLPPPPPPPFPYSFLLASYVHLTRVYPKVSGLAAWNENCKWYSSLLLGAVVSLFCESA
jgi:hypothetical protein